MKRIFNWSLVLSIFLFNLICCEETETRYIIRRDFFNGFKAGEYSVYEASGKLLLYRMETQFSFLQKLELISYPSKKVVGRLNARLNILLYNGDFSVFDQQKNEWIPGTMKRNFQLIGGSFDINWNGTRISLTVGFLSTQYRFKDQEGNLLAQYRLDIISTAWAPKYELTIYDKKFPKELYMLALAGHQHGSGRRGKSGR